MLRAAAIAVLGATGCFSPTFPDGVVACGVDDACPPGLQCFDGLCARSAGDDEADASPAVPADAADTVPADAEVPFTLRLSPTVAACTSPDAPDTAACAADAGPSSMVVDLQDTQTGNEFVTYLSFDIPADIGDRTISLVTLEMTTTDSLSAPGDTSGAIWLVEPFDFPSLSTVAPAQVEMNELAPDPGMVAANETVSWTLPNDVVGAGRTLYLGAFGNSIQGTIYWDNTGSVPPVLTVDVE